MVLTKLVIRDRLLLLRIFLRSDNFFHPPLVTGGSAQHTSHQMIMTVCMCKSMKGIVLIHAKLIRGNKDRSTGSEGNVTHSVSNGSCSDCRCRIVTGACCHFNRRRNSKLLRNFFRNTANAFIAFIKLRKHFFRNTTDLTHFLRPLTVLHIQKKHTGSIGYIRAVYSGQLICDIVLREHDLLNLFEVLRLLVLYPQNLRCSKAGKGNIRGIFGKLVLSDHIVQIITFFVGSAIVP